MCAPESSAVIPLFAGKHSAVGTCRAAGTPWTSIISRMLVCFRSKIDITSNDCMYCCCNKTRTFLFTAPLASLSQARLLGRTSPEYAPQVGHCC